MRILVIDDNERNRAAALEQLKEHDVRVVSGYDEAQRLLGGEFWLYWGGNYHGKKEAAPERGKHNFDVVLVDLLMPAHAPWAIDYENERERKYMPGMRFIGQEMPLGIFLALLAAKNGAKYVAVLTDSDHHSHPASACFDAFGTGKGEEPAPFTVAGAKTVLSNNREWIENGVKNWRKLLDYLLING